mmetsp:Transcript_43234/g.108256  ORF Transcript_43234/g.108256 Transcript_43234/m.108256 type:complete len:205 (-) Transcript_43234:68-682(-)
MRRHDVEDDAIRDTEEELRRDPPVHPLVDVDKHDLDAVVPGGQARSERGSRPWLQVPRHRSLHHSLCDARCEDSPEHNHPQRDPRVQLRVDVDALVAYRRTRLELHPPDGIRPHEIPRGACGVSILLGSVPAVASRASPRIRHLELLLVQSPRARVDHGRVCCQECDPRKNEAEERWQVRQHAPPDALGPLLLLPIPALVFLPC